MADVKGDNNQDSTVTSSGLYQHRIPFQTIRPQLLTQKQPSFLWVQTGNISFPMTLAAFHERSLAASQCLATPPYNCFTTTLVHQRCGERLVLLHAGVI